ncbi:MAG: replicative DNA helicase [Candidatus Berkiellales bacterium]
MIRDKEALRGPQQSLPSPFKMPPHSLDAEQAVLGGLLLENKAWDQIADRITEKHFYRPDHQMIFRAMSGLMAENKPLDVITVAEALQKMEVHDQVGGLAYLGELAKNTPSAANIAAYAEIVYERAVLRELISVGTHITEAAFDPQGRVSAEILDEAEKKVFDIAERGMKSVGPEGIRSIVARAIDNIEKRFQDNTFMTGISTGFTDLDRLTTGMQPGDLIIIAGRPSMGKTTLAMNIAEHAAIRSQKSVLVFSMEMPGESLAMRMLSSLGRIDQNKLRTGKLAEEDWTKLTSAVAFLSGAKLYIDETPALSPMELRARARRVARERDSLGLIVVDYLQLMRSQGYSENRTAEISEISRSLKTLAKELKVPIIALSQLNRSLEQRPNKRPVMSDLRESGAIEQDADLIVFIYRDEVYHEDSPDKGTAEIIIAKQRNGPIGSLRLTFSGQYTRFDNFMTEHIIGK